jgi:hypothetical protein
VADTKDGSEPVIMTLTQAEALVLFEWLHVNEGRHVLADQAEQRVLWGLEASLDKQLEALFAADYSGRLNAARARVRDATD